MAENDLLTSLGKIAGIAGISVGVFFLICRQILKLPIFTMLDKSKTFRILTLMMTFAFIIGLVGIGVYFISK